MIVYTEEGGVAATIWTDVVQIFVYLAGALVCLIAVTASLPGGVGEALSAAAGGRQAAPPRFLLRPDPAVHVLGGRHRRRLPDAGHPRHRPLPRAAAAGGAQPARREPRPGAVRRPGAGPVRPVPDAGHAAVDVLRRPRLRARRRGAAARSWRPRCRRLDGLHPGRDRGGGAVALAQLDGLRDAARLLPALPAAGGRRGASRCAWARFHRGLGRLPDRRGASRPGDRLGARHRPGRARLRVGADRGRVPARRALAHRHDTAGPWPACCSACWRA